MEEYIEDLFKIYISAIDSYNSKILQTINDKYTIIDKSMFATYLYIKILENFHVEDEAATQNLKNYLLKQIIYGETGNMALAISDSRIKQSYNRVVNNLIIEKFEYKNRIISKLKYRYNPLDENDYTQLLEVCELIAEYCIINKIVEKGNEGARIFFEPIEERLEEMKNEINIATDFGKEEMAIISLIQEKQFFESTYNDLLEIVFNLRDVYRYSTLTTMIPENVLFHQYTIAVASIIFSEYLNSEKGENIDIKKIMYKALFHDFAEYNGNEIVTQVKNYNQETIDFFAKLEMADEENLRNRMGETLYEVMVNFKKEKEGYIAEMLDKIIGIAKLWIELDHMNNYTYIKSLCSIYQERFKRFNRIEDIEDIKDKKFLMDFLRENYIYIKENMMNKNEKILHQYFSDEDIDGMKKEIKELKENPQIFLK